VNVCSHESVTLPTTLDGVSVADAEAATGALGLEVLFNLVIPTVVSPARRIAGVPGGAADVLVSEWCLRAAAREPRFAEALCAFAADTAADEFRVDLGALVREPEGRARYKGGGGGDGATPVPFPIQTAAKEERGDAGVQVQGKSPPEREGADLLEAIKAAARETAAGAAGAGGASSLAVGGARGAGSRAHVLGGGDGESAGASTAVGGLAELTRIGQSLHAEAAADARAAETASEADADAAANFANTAAELFQEDALIWRAACPAGAVVEVAGGDVLVRIAVDVKAVDVASGFLADADLQIERTRIKLSVPPSRLCGYAGLQTTMVPVVIARLATAVDADSARAKWNKGSATLTITVKAV
jgi:hypothetical protein